MTGTEVFLLAMALVLGAPYLLWRLGRTESIAPLVVIQILSGVALGPGVLGAWQPEVFALMFGPRIIQSIDGMAIWAVTLFVWIAGLELDLRQVWHAKQENFTAAALLLIVPLSFGSLAAAGLLQWSGWKGDAAEDWQFVLGIGMSCAVTALPILMLFMQKLGILRTPLGQRVLRYSSLDDIAIWAVLALILMEWNRLGLQLLFLLAFALASFFMRRQIVRVPEGDRWYLALIWLPLCAFGADASGLHFMVGAFLAGVVLDAAWFNDARVDAVRENILLILMPVFFLSTGLRTHWQSDSLAVIVVAVVLLLAAISGKLIGARMAGRLLGWQPSEASVIGWLLQSKALIMIIFANVLADRQLISSNTFASLLFMAVGSTMLTMPCVSAILRGRRAAAQSIPHR